MKSTDGEACFTLLHAVLPRHVVTVGGKATVYFPEEISAFLFKSKNQVRPTIDIKTLSHMTMDMPVTGRITALFTAASVRKQGKLYSSLRVSFTK